MASLAETRLAVISLVHRHDASAKDLIDRAEQIMDWISKDNATETGRPKKRGPKEVTSSEP